MHFNIKKCVILSITRKHIPSQHQYVIFEEVFERVNRHNYLELTTCISHDLCWDVHCQVIKQKKIALWVFFDVRYHHAIKQVQRAVTHFVFGDYHRTTSVTPLLTNYCPGLVSASYKAFDLSSDNFLQNPPLNCYNPVSICHSTCSPILDYLTIVSSSRMQLLIHVSYPSIHALWNQLPTSAVIAATNAAFQEAALPAIRRMRPPVGLKLFKLPCHDFSHLKFTQW